MVEIDMTLGELPSCKVEEIKASDQKRATSFLRRRKYKLFGAFFSATLIHPNDSPIEFEVSIGRTWLSAMHVTMHVTMHSTCDLLMPCM